MTCGVFGEMTADGQWIILVASGDDHELDRAAAALRRMTPLLSKTDPPGALRCPLTWAAVVQLGHAFDGRSLGQWVPGPRLREWALAELRKRTATDPETAPRGLPDLAAIPVQPAKDPQLTASGLQVANVGELAASDHRPASTLVLTASPGEPATMPQTAVGQQEKASGAEPAATDARTATRGLPDLAAISLQPAIEAETARAASSHEPGINLQPAANRAGIAKKIQPAAASHEPARGLRPRPYQLEVAARIASTGKFLLFDEPGCGKTPSAILGLIERQKLGYEIFPLVVVTPSWDVCDVWARHIADWAPHWPAVVMYSGPGRQAAREGILATTFATARLDAASMTGPLVRLRAKAVVIDEVHVCRNDNSLQTKAVQRIASRASTFIGLSGTPVTRDTGDIFPVLAAMDPLSWPSRERMVKRYCMTEEDGYGQKIQGLEPLAEPEFRAVLLGQYRRVTKADVLPQLPPKVYSTRRVELPPAWRKAYDGLAADMLAELPDSSELSVMSVLSQLTRLSQLASSACDVEVTLEQDPAGGEEKKRYDVTLRAPSWKVDSLLEILAERTGQQVAVFAVSRQLAVIAGQACKAEGYRAGYIVGSQGKKDRRDAIAAFQAGELDVIIATAGAGSLGITLTAAGTVVMLQRSWQLDQALQPEDRAHRLDDIVLRHPCIEVIDVIARNTVDDRVRSVLRSKGGQLSELVKDRRVALELLGGIP